MKFARFEVENQVRTGVETPVGFKEIDGDMFGEWVFTGEVFARDKVTLLAPLKPNQIIGIGANYVAEESQLPVTLPELPVFFIKSIGSVVGPEAAIVLPNGIDEVKFESELAVVIGKTMKDVPETEVFDYVFGYTIGNDVTAPQLFHPDGHWTLGKSFDTSTPLGPVVETDLNPESINVESYLNDEKKQDSPANLMIISTRKMLSYLSKKMTLSCGDVVLTGSPAGAEFLKDGDSIACEINEIGVLRNPVITSTQVAKRFLHFANRSSN